MKPIISAQVRVRCPDHFHVGEGSIIDDFSYFSTRVIVGRWSHIASGCTVAGGQERTFRFGDFSSLSSGVKVWCTSDDFVNDLVTILPPECPEVKTHLITGDVTMGNFTAVGSNSVIMPDNEVPEGTVIGALSFVPPRFKFKPWSVYVGSPVRLLKARNEVAVRAQIDRVEEFLRSRRGQP